MKVRLSRNIRRWALLSLITAGSFGVSPTSLAAHDGIDKVPSQSKSLVTEQSALSRADIDCYNEWCGWCTHDSTPVVPRVASVSRTSSAFAQTLADAAATATAKTSLVIEQVVEPFAVVSTKQPTSIEQLHHFNRWNSFSQIVKKATDLVTIATPGDANLDAVSEFTTAATSQDDAAFDVVSIEHAQASDQHVPFVDFPMEPGRSIDDICFAVGDEPVPDWNQCNDDQFAIVATEHMIRRQLNDLASQEPIDVDPAVESVQPSVAESIVAQTLAKPVLSEVSEEVSRSPRVGAAPVIVTIEEPYLPYDLAEQDVRLWFPLGLTTKPFCMRSQLTLDDLDPLWTESIGVESNRTGDQASDVAANIAVTETAEQELHQTLQASADCLLDEFVWQANEWLDAGAGFRQAVSPQGIGAAFVNAWSQADRATSHATKLIARVWPTIPEKAKPQQQLLVRAEALEVNDADQDCETAADLAETAEQIAQELDTPADTASLDELQTAVETLREWYSNVESFSRGWLQVAEIIQPEALSR